MVEAEGWVQLSIVKSGDIPKPNIGLLCRGVKVSKKDGKEYILLLVEGLSLKIEDRVER